MLTTLVLGAGASKPYGFPLGSELIGRVASTLPRDPRLPPRGALVEALQLLANRGVLPSQPDRFARHLADFRRLLVEQYPRSIDNFLARSFGIDTNVFRWIGRLAITQVIGACEDWAVIDSPKSQQEGQPADDWYKQFWQELGLDGTASLGHVPLNVISFNYDRSFDAFLAERLTFLGPEQLKTRAYRDRSWWQPGVRELGQLRLTHPYGSLGSLEELEFGALNPIQSGHDLVSAARRIFVIGDERGDDSFAQARSWIAEADRVVFLGFGFDPTNMQRLGLLTGMPRTRSTDAGIQALAAFATTYGLERAERSRVRELYFLQVLRDWGQEDCAIDHSHVDVGITTCLRRTGAVHFAPSIGTKP